MAPLARVSADGPSVVLRAPELTDCPDSPSVARDSVLRAIVTAGDLEVPVLGEQLPEILRYARTRAITLVHGNREVAVGPAARPRLRLNVGEQCPRIESCRDGWIDAPLETVIHDGSRIRLCSGSADVVARPEQISKAELELENTPAYRPRWGLGVDLAGPALVGSLTGHWYPADFLALELGGFPFGGSAIIGIWAGARLRFRAGNSNYWSVGAAAGTLDNMNAESVDEPYHAVGPRLAFEYVFPSQRDVLRLECQLAYGNLFSRNRHESTWYPWGGLAIVRWF